MTEPKQNEDLTEQPQPQVKSVSVRFAGDSGDGMQLTGDQFTDTAALMGNDFATLPDYPAEIRAPVGTLPGVSSFQIQFSDSIIYTPGDQADVLVAMNPAALKVNIPNVKKGGLIIINESVFSETNLRKAAWTHNPLNDDTLKDFKVLPIALSELTRKALEGHPLKGLEVERCKNFYALGLTFWLYQREMKYTIEWIQKKFQKRPEIVEGNITALKSGYSYADVAEITIQPMQIHKAKLAPGTYRKVTGNEATALGLIAAARLANKTLFYGTYPITPASEILHYLALHKNYDVKTFQAEDEIAGIGSAVGAAFGGQIGVTGTSGPGMCLKAEMLNLAVMAELPLVVVDVQRSGPSTGMPTKTEQTDLLMSVFGRNGESPVVVLAPKTPADCFDMAIEAVRIAVKYMTPVIMLSEGNLANAAEPWKLPDVATLPKIEISHPVETDEKFMPYKRDEKTLSRPWAIPGTKGLEHRIGGLAKADLTGNVSYNVENNQKMIDLRAAKIRGIANDIPEIKVRGPKTGKLLVLSWGGTFGPIYQAVSNLRNEEILASHAHLNYLNPFPSNLGNILKDFETILVPELNMGQLTVLLRNEFPGIRAVGLNKVKGQPFKVVEIERKIRELL